VVILYATDGLNRCRFDMLAEQILLIFVPAPTQNGDRKALVTAHPLPKGNDFVSQASTQSCVRGAFFTVHQSWVTVVPVILQLVSCHRNSLVVSRRLFFIASYFPWRLTSRMVLRTEQGHICRQIVADNGGDGGRAIRHVIEDPSFAVESVDIVAAPICVVPAGS
jgi:hypothetical protein